jgi:hypothetical protein
VLLPHFAGDFSGYLIKQGEKKPPLCAGAAEISFLQFKKNYKEPFRVGAGLKPTVLLALIFISAPVCGLRPFLAFLFLTVNVPKEG